MSKIKILDTKEAILKTAKTSVTDTNKAEMFGKIYDYYVKVNDESYLIQDYIFHKDSCKIIHDYPELEVGDVIEVVKYPEGYFKEGLSLKKCKVSCIYPDGVQIRVEGVVQDINYESLDDGRIVIKKIEPKVLTGEKPNNSKWYQMSDGGDWTRGKYKIIGYIEGDKYPYYTHSAWWKKAREVEL